MEQVVWIATLGRAVALHWEARTGFKTTGKRGLGVNFSCVWRCSCMETKKRYILKCVQRCIFFFHISMTSTLFFQGMDTNIFKEAFESPKVDFILSHAIYCRDVLKLKKGQRAVISNGRVRSDGESDSTRGKEKMQALSSRDQMCFQT